MLQSPALRSSIAVALGAIPGALSRYYFQQLSVLILGSDRAYWGTFFVNITGCFAIAFILTLAAERIRAISVEQQLLLTTGFCGSYTTFSAYELETQLLLSNAQFLSAFLYWMSSAVVGLISIRLGMAAARTWGNRQV